MISQTMKFTSGAKAQCPCRPSRIELDWSLSAAFEVMRFPKPFIKDGFGDSSCPTG